ncbi:MAG: hypothetical protein ACRDYX_05445 [Egibacteraceae bacterium]
MAATAAIVLTGCELPWSAFEAEDPVAIRASSGEVEVLLVPCSPAGITSLHVTGVRETAESRDYPRVWQVDFSPPATDLRRVVLGQVPPGGTERVPWPPAGLDSLGQEYGYIVQVQLDGGDHWIQGFRQQNLTEGRILFHNESLSPDAFADKSRCPGP